MKKFLRLAMFGFLSWLVTFGASVCLFFLKKGNERLFETSMGIVLTGCTVTFTSIYFRKIQTAFVREGVLLGLAFVTCNILFDLPMFSAGPMQMPLIDYLKNIGLAYLSMPIVTLGFGCLLQGLLRPAAAVAG